MLRHPRTRFTARIAGLNLIRGTFVEGGVRDGTGLEIEGMPKEGEEARVGEPAAAVFSPAGVSIYIEPHQGSPRNNVPVTVAELEPLGDLVRVRSDDHHGHVLSADVTVRSAPNWTSIPGARSPTL